MPWSFLLVQGNTSGGSLGAQQPTPMPSYRLSPALYRDFICMHVDTLVCMSKLQCYTLHKATLDLTDTHCNSDSCSQGDTPMEETQADPEKQFR